MKTSKFVFLLLLLFGLMLIGCASQNAPSNSSSSGNLFEQAMISGIKEFDDHHYESAVAYFEKAKKIEPKNGDSYGWLASTFQKSKEYAKAESNYQEAIKLSPNNLEFRLNYARLLATCPDNQIRNGTKALEMAKQLIDKNLDPNLEPNILATIAYSYAEVGQFDEAAQMMQKSVDHPNLPADLKTTGKERLELFKNKKVFRLN